MSVYPDGADVRREATISDDGLYRYSLVRRWAQKGGPATFVMLNPSTADALVDDPTIRRCVGFARSWGCAGIVVVNLYALRATRPVHLWEAADPVGPDNDRFLEVAVRRAAATGAPLLGAWGANAKPGRVEALLELVKREGASLEALGVTKWGQPRHPLYLPADAQRLVMAP